MMASVTIEDLLNRIESLEARLDALESKPVPYSTPSNSESSFDLSLPQEIIDTAPAEQPGHLCSHCGNQYTHILRVTPQNAGEFVFKVVTIYCSKCGKESQIEIA
jgi:hypothetical protein